MKSIVLTIFLLFALSGIAKKPEKDSITKQKITYAANEFRNNDGFQVVRIGSIGIHLIKSLVKIEQLTENTIDDEMVMMLKMLDGIKRIEIIQYEDCRRDVRENCDNRFANILDGSNLLFQAKDDGDLVNIYGELSDQDNLIQDLIIHARGESALICIYGKFSVDSVLGYATGI